MARMIQGNQPPAAVTFSEAFRFWLKLGFIGFGGPAGQIAIMHTELVERRRWISEKRFLHALNYCMLLPGPEAQQLATYIGWLMHRTWGGIVAGGLFVLPSLFILIALSWVYVRFGHVPVVAGVFFGLKPAVTALVLHAAHRVGTRALRNGWMWAIAAAAFVAIFALEVPFPAAAVVGVILNLALFFAWHVLWPQGFAGSFEWVSAAIALAALVALFRFKIDVLTLLAASAALGLVSTLAV
jgi:chromate transporter